METLTLIMAWVYSHPYFMSAIVWPLLTSIVTALFKPRTPEEYAEMNPRLAAMLKFVAASGLDPLKAVEAAKQFVSGEAKTPEEMRDGGAK